MASQLRSKFIYPTFLMILTIDIIGHPLKIPHIATAEGVLALTTSGSPGS